MYFIDHCIDVIRDIRPDSTLRILPSLGALAPMLAGKHHGTQAHVLE